MSDATFTAAPCRYCNEREWLSLNVGFDCESYAHEADGSLQMDGAEPALVMVDYIECDICGCTAPAHVWNGAPVTARMRLALVHEYRAQGASPQFTGRPAAVAA